MERFKHVRAALTKRHDNAAIDDVIDWLTFLLGLLPDVAGGQVAQIGNKIINDQRLNDRFGAIRKDILTANAAINEMEAGLARVGVIAAAAVSREEIHRDIIAFAEELKVQIASEPTHFSVETTDWSEQQIINCIIEADHVFVSADRGSRNVVEETNVTSKQTDLRATNRSTNLIRDTTFKGEKGSVGMSGTHTQEGHISVSNASIGYQGPNSGTQMGGWYMGTDAQGDFVIGTRPATLTAQCPSCRREFSVHRFELTGNNHFRCPLCGHLAQVPPLP